MKTRFLHSFTLTVDHGCLAEAARLQNLTAAAVAQQVRALERELGVVLLRRVGRSMQPTPAGQRLFASARALLQAEEQMRNLVRDDSFSGELRLGTINTALHSLMPALLGRLATTYPQLQVLIQSATTQSLVHALREQTIDLAVCLHPAFTLPKSMRWELLREEPLVVLAPITLASQSALQCLRDQPFIRYDHTLGGGQQVAQFLRMHGIVPHERFELSSLLAIALMVDQGLGVSLVPDIHSPLITHLRIARLLAPAPRPVRRFGMLWQLGGPRAHLVQAVVTQTRLLLSGLGQAESARR